MSLILEKRQLELEEESVSAGYSRYMKDREYSRAHNNEDDTLPGQQLISRVIDAVGAAIEEDRNTVRRGKNRVAVSLVEEVESHVLAWHALRAIVRGISHEPTFTQVSAKAGGYIRDEINYRRFSEHEPTKYRITQEHIKKHRSGAAKRGVITRLTKGEGTDVVKWSKEDTIRVGSYIVDIALVVTGWAAVVNVKQGRKTPKVLQPSQIILDWIENAHEELAALAPQRFPMLVPPRPWEGPTGGGYLSNVGPELTLVKTRNKRYLEALEYSEMPDVYAALNRLQNTAWGINKGVLDVALALYEEGIQVGPDGDESLPSRNPSELPQRPANWDGLPYKELTEKYTDAYRLWAGKAAVVHESNRRLASKRLSALSAIHMAKRFTDDAIYFPYQLDFRGRVYPVSAYLQPQGDDLCKGLLRFAEGKPITADGVAWLKVHISNCFGVDKVSFAERVAWTEAHINPILESALNPLDPEAFWLTADEPFQALAACFEFAGWYAEGDDYVSHLPISVDGSCNGLQNFSALLKDAVGGASTNLVPSDKPADIYAEVARVTAEKVREAAEAGDENAVIFDGYITRSLVKQPVMTLPYGATLMGMRSQLEDAIRKAGNPMGLATKDSWSACGYLAATVREAISEVVVAAVEAMDWLRKVSSVVSSDEHPVSWTTPCGFPVLQEYRMPEAKQIWIHIDGQQRRIHVEAVGKRLNKRRQSSSIAPNFVHSLDSSHLMLTVLLAEANGVDSFMVVHDSFGTHACDVGTLQASLRHAFVEQYTPNVLATFKEEVESQYGVELPDVPAAGALDLNAVIDSPYFFS